MKIKLVGDDGESTEYMMGLVKLIEMFISASVLYLGYIWILIDK